MVPGARHARYCHRCNLGLLPRAAQCPPASSLCAVYSAHCVRPICTSSRVALEFPSYGWPRMTRELRRRGWKVNHKRVYRLMREDNLLCLRKRKFVVTTDSPHDLPVYPNLVPTLKLTGLDQLWVA